MSANSCTGPPLIETFFNLFPAKNAMNWLSGDQNGNRGAVGALKLTRLTAANRSQPEVGLSGDGRVDDVSAIGRNCQLCVVASASSARPSERRLLGRSDREPDEIGWASQDGMLATNRGLRDQRDRRERRDQPSDSTSIPTPRSGRSETCLMIEDAVYCRDVADASTAVLHQALTQERSNRRGNIGRERLPRRLEVDDRAEDVRRIFTIKRTPRRQDLEQHAAEGPDVAALVGLESFGLFRRHVRGRSEDDACPVSRAGLVMVGDCDQPARCRILLG